MITVSNGGTLTLDNITVDGGNSKDVLAWGIVVKSGGKLLIKEGTVLQNHKKATGDGAADAYSYGSVLRVYGSVVMDGGEITNCECRNYGNIWIDASAEFTMNGGTIHDNSLANVGTFGGGAFYVYGVLRINGGTISDHTNITNYGGAIYCTSVGRVYLNGGVISNNTVSSDLKGDAIFYSSRAGDSAELYIGGNPLITNSIYLDNTGAAKYPYITSQIKNPLTLVVDNYAENRIIAQGSNDYHLTEADLAKVTLKVQGSDTQYYAKLDETNNRLLMTNQNPGYTKKYNISYFGNGGTGSTVDNNAYGLNDSATIMENGFSREGHAFNGWNTDPNGNGTAYKAGDKINITDDLILYAQWTKNAYTVTFDVQGKGTALQPVMVPYNTTVSEPTAPTADGYTFGGWYENEDCSDGREWDFTTPIIGNTTLYAKWTATVQEHKHTVGGTEITFQPWTEEDSLPTETGSYYLTKDVTITSTWQPANNVNLCLNGKTITMNSSYNVITVDGKKTFNLYDEAANEGKITHGVDAQGKKYDGRGVLVAGSESTAGSTFNMYGGNITGNITESDGGGVQIAGAWNTFNMYGGSITDNKAVDTDWTGDGGGVNVGNYCIFNMYGGTISGNTAKYCGGGVNNNPSYSTFNMYGGTITGNYGRVGGGVHLYYDMTVSGTVNITGNYALSEEDYSETNNPSNVVCESNKIELNNLNTDTRIGITKQPDYRFATGASADVVQCFISDNSSYQIELRGTELFTIRTSHTHTWVYDVDADRHTITASCMDSGCGASGGTLTLSADSATYDGNSHEAAVTESAWQAGSYTVTYKNSRDESLTAAPTNAGTYMATLTVGVAAVSVNYTIEKAALTANDFNFAAPSDLQYENGHVKAATVTPNKNGIGDIIAVKYYKNGNQVDANAVEDVGTYTVGIDVAAGENYNAAAGLTDGSWTFTITDKAAPAVSFADKTAAYTGQAITHELVSLPEGVASAVYKYKGIGNTTYAESTTAPTNAGTYEVTAAFTMSPNYAQLAAKTAKLTIDPTILTVTPNALSKIVGANDPVLTYTVSGAQNNEVPEFTGALSRVQGETAGTYAINLGTLALADKGAFKAFNYTLQFSSTPVLFTINTRSSGGSSGGGSSTPKYTVTVPSSTTGGSAKSSVSSASGGSTVTITVTPADGYKVDKVSVADSKGNSIKVTDKGGNKYTFTMPSSKVTVTPSFSKIEETKPETSPFDDVTANDYFYDAVKWAADKGITGGVSSGLFAPKDGCTRAQIVTFLWRTAGSPEPKALSSFADVPADAYYAKAVAWAVENGITVGTTATTFSPDVICTRAHGVTFLYRAAKAAAPAGESVFSDVSAGAYYADAVKWATEKGITKGISSTLFGPNNTCTRAQIVTFLYRLYGGK